MSVKKITYFLLIGVLFIGFGCEKDSLSKKDPISNGNYPKLGEYRIKRAVHYSSSTSSEERSGIEYFYNQEGNLIRESYYNYPAKTLFLEKVYEYSDKVRIGQKIYSGETDKLTVGLYSVFHYLDGHLIKEEVFSGYDNSFVHSLNYEYHGNNLVRKYRYDPAFGIMGEMKYTYDNNSKLVLEENSSSNVDEYKYKKHVYGENGREVRIEYLNVNKDLLFYTDKVYEKENPNPLQELKFSKNGKLEIKYKHFYDRWNNLTETVINDGCSTFRRKFDGELLIESISYSLTWGCVEAGMTKYEYEKIK